VKKDTMFEDLWARSEEPWHVALAAAFNESTAAEDRLRQLEAEADRKLKAKGERHDQNRKTRRTY